MEKTLCPCGLFPVMINDLPTPVAAPGSKRWVFIVKKSQPNAGKILEIRSISAAHHT
jgi:hypothetical protein